ncbi:alpha-ketoacid dehydrogenase subunit beta [Patescibacteria group bacterium]|nr:alpha-ketoacid dehydrogenase subunit beta [Desulfobacteraceae bacterium]MBU4027150.1 alpha-ketoacid dehydrogenase subunit beta [Patescibacteria group bacterium]MBU4069266.1 alpha-ketoacid dehydrogenase subunit beta [Pseudomonadota bacterium]
MTRTLTFAQAINEALAQAMEIDESVICYGLGVPDPKGVFGTTLGLQDRFGEARVFDMPASENAMTGVAIGASLNGIRSVMTHQRVDFFLLAMDQLVNNAAKWHYMFGGQSSVPITIRLIIGRGWGQGPTHSQSLQAWFAHVPGLKVVMPATASDAKGLLISSIFDDNPVIFLEHRWLHSLKGDVPEGDFRVPIGKAQRLKSGNDISIVSLSYMTIEALHATEFLERMGILCDLIDLRSVKPVDWEMIFDSVRKTGRLLTLDTGASTGSIAGEVIARVSMECFDTLKQAPKRLALPDFPTPTSPSLVKGFYRCAEDIVEIVGSMLGKEIKGNKLVEQRSWPHDVPGDWFKGPF